LLGLPSTKPRNQSFSGSPTISTMSSHRRSSSSWFRASKSCRQTPTHSPLQPQLLARWTLRTSSSHGGGVGPRRSSSTKFRGKTPDSPGRLCTLPRHQFRPGSGTAASCTILPAWNDRSPGCCASNVNNAHAIVWLLPCAPCHARLHPVALSCAFEGHPPPQEHLHHLPARCRHARARPVHLRVAPTSPPPASRHPRARRPCQPVSAKQTRAGRSGRASA
jgi:hypothetical protein